VRANGREDPGFGFETIGGLYVRHIWAFAGAPDGSRLFIAYEASEAPYEYPVGFRVAELDPATGRLGDWVVDLPMQPWTMAVSRDSRTVLVGGESHWPPSSDNLIAYDAATGQRRAWAAPVDEWDVTELATGPGGAIYAVLQQEFENAVTRIDLATGALHWSVETNEPASRFHVAPGRLYVGGWFTHIGGVSHPCLAALDPDTGAPLPWGRAPAG
jgi:outer membrane protein assembly factor BamB